jgi:HK97 gp10 family phage protein
MAKLHSLKWYGKEVLQAIFGVTDDGLFEGAQAVADLARGNAPVRSGKLRDSIYAKSATQSTYEKRKGHYKELEVEPGVAVVAAAMFYAGKVEMGTRQAAAQPYLRPALDEAGESVGSRIVTAMGKDLK